MKVFVTGSAGFVGFHLCRRLLGDGHEVLGYDGMTEYYSSELKRRRVAILTQSAAFTSCEALLEDSAALNEAIGHFDPDVVVHLAAQAGVRYSIDHPEAYVSANVVGTFNVLEAARALKPQHLMMASTSTVYGGNQQVPFREDDRTDFPVSLYAATKKACEAMSHAYAHLYKIPTTCFRFFTVYGPWGRPDMALFKFVEAIRNDRPIEVFGDGQMLRDFTYVDDLVEGILRLVAFAPEEGKPVVAEGVVDSLSPVAPWRSVNVGGGRPVGLLAFIEAIERSLGVRARKIMRPMQQGDVTATHASALLLEALTGFRPATPLSEGVQKFVEWYDEYVGQYRT